VITLTGTTEYLLRTGCKEHTPSQVGLASEGYQTVTHPSSLSVRTLLNFQ